MRPRFLRPWALLAVFSFLSSVPMVAANGSDATATGLALPPGMQRSADADPRSDADKLRDPLPRPVIPFTSSSNVDFASRLAFAAPSYQAVAVDAGKLYAGFGRDLAIFSLLDPAHPILLGWVETPERVHDVAVSGNYAYTAGLGTGVHKVDVSNPASPFVAGTYNTTGFAYGVAVDSGYAYVADLAAGLHKVDTTTMTLAGTYNTSGAAVGVAIAGGYAYVADGISGLQKIDTATMTLASPGNYDTPGSAVDVVISGGFAYVADGGSGIQKIDTATMALASPGTYNSPGNAQGIALIGSYAVIADNAAGVELMDTATMTELDSTAITGVQQGVAVSGSYAYVADTQHGLRAFAVSGASVTQTSLVDGFLNIRGVATRNGLAYLAADLDGLVIADCSLLSRPVLLSKLPLGGSARRVWLDGDLAYVADYNGGLKIVDVSQPGAPSIVGTYATAGTALHVSVAGTRAYVAESGSGVRILDVSDPSTPALLGTYTGSTYPLEVKVVGSLAYVVDQNNFFRIVDVSDPALPSLVSSIVLPNQPNALTLAGTLAYLSVGWTGVYVVNVANPAAPVPMGGQSLSAEAYGTVVVNGRAYVADSTGGLRILSLADPVWPTEVGYYDPTFGLGEAVAYSGGYAYLANQGGGAYILHYAGEDCYDALEPNDDRGQALALPSGQDVDGYICSSGDEDWFSLPVSGAGTLDIVMHPPTAEDYDLHLYDGNGVLLAVSANSGSSSESISWPAVAADTLYLRVRGHDGTRFTNSAFYNLSWLFTATGSGPCTPPDEALYIYTVILDGNGKPVLHVMDPNQPESRTGYNMYRSSAPTGPWTLMGSNVVDMDGGTANVQWVDLTGDVGGPWYYKANAYNGACSQEGP